MSEEKRTVAQTQRLLYIYMLALLLSGSAITIVYKLQNDTTYTDDKGEKHPYSHPFFAAMVTSIGQSMTLVVYFVKEYIFSRRKKPS